MNEELVGLKAEIPFKQPKPFFTAVVYRCNFILGRELDIKFSTAKTVLRTVRSLVTLFLTFLAVAGELEQLEECTVSSSLAIFFTELRLFTFQFLLLLKHCKNSTLVYASERLIVYGCTLKKRTNCKLSSGSCGRC